MAGAAQAWRLLTGALLALLLCPALALAFPMVTGAGVGADGRVVFELSQALQYRIFSLPSPYRVVVDLPQVDWRAGGGTLLRDDVVVGLRSGLFQPGTTRVVLDLRGPARIRSAVMQDAAGGRPARLVIDLEPVAAAAFQKQVVEPATTPPIVVPPASSLSIAPTAAVPALQPARPPAATRRERPLIVVDAGHGGPDPGATGVGGTQEKDVTLAMARALKHRLDMSGRYRVLLTRDDDVFLPLRDRREIARAEGAALFLSIHADSAPNGDVRGLSVYTLSERASDAEAEALAAKENKADLIAGVNLSGESPEVTNILIDLAQRETKNFSVQVAHSLVQELGRETITLQKAHRFAGFAVLKAPDVPSALIELGYLSNPSDERLLLQPAFRARLADGIARAVDSFFAARAPLKRT